MKEEKMIGIIIGIVVGMLMATIDHRRPNPTCNGYWRCFGTYFVITLAALVGFLIERTIRL